MIERKIYAKWAFSENEREKAEINGDIYKELCGKYRISRGSDCNPDEYDIVIRGTPGYNHSEYRIIKKPDGISLDELALICDQGNLCFGYTVHGCPEDVIYVFED